MSKKFVFGRAGNLASRARRDALKGPSSEEVNEAIDVFLNSGGEIDVLHEDPGPVFSTSAKSSGRKYSQGEFIPWDY